MAAAAVVQFKFALAQILIMIIVRRGSIPQVFFVLHPAEAQNRSLKDAKLAITFNYVHTHVRAIAK